jgi:hypothetical protein
MMIGDLSLQVKEMFYHAFDNYMRHAFPLDELRPMSCTGEDSLGSYSLTLIDALDMLALLGDRARFSEAVNWLGKNLQFGKVHLLPLGHILHATWLKAICMGNQRL